MILLDIDLRYDDGAGGGDLILVEGIPEEGSDNFGNLEALANWHCNDPVLDYERGRNEVIFRWQKNRNPFIDYPQWAEYIFGFDCVKQR